MTHVRLPFFLRRLWRLLEARRALYEGAPERALGALRDPALALSPRAELLRARALDVLFRDAARRASEGRGESVARLLGVAAAEDPARANEWRRHLTPPPEPLPEGPGRSDGPDGAGPSGPVRDLLVRLRADEPDGAPRARLAGWGGPPRLAPLVDEGAPIRFHLAVDDGGDLFVVSARSITIGHARAGAAHVPLLADIESLHARLTYGESFHGGPTWRIEPLTGSPVRVDGREVEGARTLHDGEVVRLSGNLEFRFSRPDPASASALLELLHGVEAEGSRRVLLFVPGASGRIRVGARTSRHVPVVGIDHEIDLALERDQEYAALAVRCAGGVRTIGDAAEAGREVRVELPPADRVDLVLGARPSQRAPFGLSLVPVAPSTLDRSPRDGAST